MKTFESAWTMSLALAFSSAAAVDELGVGMICPHTQVLS
jgi:hypothetical protein